MRYAALLTASAMAAKQTSGDDYSDVVVDWTDDYTVDTTQQVIFSIEDDWRPGLVDDITHQWYNEQLMPFYQLHKNGVAEQAIDRAEQKYGPLYNTCELGLACRAKKKAVLIQEMQTEWKGVLQRFEQDVKNTIQSS